MQYSGSALNHAPTRGRITNPILLAITLLWVVCQGSLAHAQISAKDLADPALSDADRKEATLLWLDKYVSDSLLMKPEDIAKIRAAVAQMNPSQLEQWLKQTSQLREYVESPAWQDTKQWLRGFLRVQAIYSDKEIEALRKEIFNADADQMLAIMERIRAKHESLTWMYQASQQERATAVQQRNASVAAQAAAAQQSRASRSSNLPLFGTGVAQTQTKKSGYRPPGPLITSNEVARAAVWSQVWGGGGWGIR